MGVPVYLIVQCKRGILFFYIYLFVRIANDVHRSQRLSFRYSMRRVPQGRPCGSRPSRQRPCPAVAAGTFTQNRFPAAPVLVAKAMLAGRPAARAVVINSGQANACTGDEGMRNCRTTQELVAGTLGLESVGCPARVHGRHRRAAQDGSLGEGRPALAANLGKATPEDFAKAIMTTDGLPQNFAPRSLPSRRRGKARGHGQGRGHDLPQHGDHAVRRAV